MLAAQYGAPEESVRSAIIGCGARAKYQLEAMRSEGRTSASPARHRNRQSLPKTWTLSCFVAGASADNPEKHKIAPGLTYRAGVESRFDLSGLSA
jgi:hypothetical protein